MLKISSIKRGLPGKNQSTIFDKMISRLWIDPPEKQQKTPCSVEGKKIGDTVPFMNNKRVPFADV